MKYEGIMTALVTPVIGDNVVDESAMKKLINYQLESGISGLVFLGGTGEYTALSKKERKRAIDIAVKNAGNKVPVIIGILEPGIADCIEIALYSKKVGADAIMVLTPYYVHPAQEGIIEFYKELNDAVDMPIILYNIPYRTSVNMLPETVEKLIDLIPNIVGIKECTPNLSQATDLIRLVGDRISVLCGEEFYAVAEFILGAHGAVMATANIIPDKWIHIFEMIKGGYVKEAVQTYLEFFPLFQSIFSEVNPGPLKKAMEMIGLPVGNSITPLQSPSDNTVTQLKDIMEKLDIH